MRLQTEADVNHQRLEQAKRLGADIMFSPTDIDPVEAILELTAGVGVDCCLETSGAASARSAAIRATKTWGTACFVGEGGEVKINVSPELLRKQMTVIGSWTFSITGQSECACFVASKGIDVGQVYTHRWSPDQAEEAYRLFDQGVGGKGVFLL